MYTKKDIGKLEKLGDKYNIEIYGVCKKCGEHWCTLEEFKIIKECENCETGEYIHHYADVDDTFKAIENMEEGLGFSIQKQIKNLIKYASLKLNKKDYDYVIYCAEIAFGKDVVESSLKLQTSKDKRKEE